MNNFNLSKKRTLKQKILMFAFKESLKISFLSVSHRWMNILRSYKAEHVFLNDLNRTNIEDSDIVFIIGEMNPLRIKVLEERIKSYKSTLLMVHILNENLNSKYMVKHRLFLNENVLDADLFYQEEVFDLPRIKEIFNEVEAYFYHKMLKIPFSKKKKRKES